MIATIFRWISRLIVEGARLNDVEICRKDFAATMPFEISSWSERLNAKCERFRGAGLYRLLGQIDQRSRVTVDQMPDQ